MKLSDFLKTKKISFFGGEVKIENALEDGDMEFYDLTRDKLLEIKENLIDKLDTTYTEEKFTYDILPYVCNVERDIDMDQFFRLMSAPSKEFTYFQEALIDVINNVFQLVKRQTVLNEKLENMKHDNPELFIKEETKEEKIIKLTKEMESETDIKKKMELIKILAKLYEEVENG